MYMGWDIAVWILESRILPNKMGKMCTHCVFTEKYMANMR